LNYKSRCCNSHRRSTYCRQSNFEPKSLADIRFIHSENVNQDVEELDATLIHMDYLSQPTDETLKTGKHILLKQSLRREKRV
jgi:hypothetical protein